MVTVLYCILVTCYDVMMARVQVEDPGALFEWVDGVVVRAMKEGGCLMVDEISLADDAVLERLNSVLEPERKLVVSEKSRTQSGEVFQIVASAGFQFLATMNPGGDYGKKEVRRAISWDNVNFQAAVLHFLCFIVGNWYNV